MWKSSVLVLLICFAICPFVCTFDKLSNIIAFGINGFFFADGFELPLPTDRWTSCFTHFVTNDGACIREFGNNWHSAGETESCGFISLGKRVLCRIGKRKLVS